MLKRTARRILAWSVVFAMLFSLTAQPAAAADTSADTSAAAYSAQADEDAAEETTEAESDEDAGEEAETDPADDSGEADESADASVEQAADESAEESAEEAADESSEEATLTVSAAAISEEEDEEEEAYATVTASAYTEPSTDSNGVYQISTASELFWFAQKVNNGTTGANAVLTADIDLESASWTPIANYYSNSRTYEGTFDGQGYTISGLYYYDIGYSYVGLFGYVGGSGTVKNVTVSGSVYGYYCVGGIAGYNAGTISGCVNQVSVNSKHSGGGIAGVNSGTITSCGNTGSLTGIYDESAIASETCLGGITGLNDGGLVTNCWNSGTINGSNSQWKAVLGGIVGINSVTIYGATNTSTVSNCYNVGTITQGSASSYYLGSIVPNYYYYGSSTGTITNCYYLSTVQSDSKATSKTADQFASGEVAYLLNGSVFGGANWYQNIDNGETTDSYPVPDSSHGTVYYGYTCTSTTAGYTNSPANDTQGHSYDEYGFCTKCGNYEPATLKNGVYQISNAGQLFWFAALVNGNTTYAELDEQNLSANAELTCDIELSVTTDTHTSTSWTPIGSSSFIRYSGTFDGKGYTISGLYRSTTLSNFIGLFGYVTGTVQNVSVSGTVKGLVYVGGIVAYNAGEISNCCSTVTVSGSNVTALYIGGIAGYNSGTITNCYSIGTVADKGGSVGSVVGKNSGTVTNCYYLDTLLEDDYATAKTADEFASGEVAYLLNKSVSGGATWFQTIGTDETPVLSSTHGTVYCGYAACGATETTYSNSELSDTAIAHNYDDDGFCTNCGAYEPAELNSDGYYEITNAGNLFWFAALVNGDTTQEDVTEAVSGANAILTADIDLSVTTSTHTSAEWTPIGDCQAGGGTDYTLKFTGTFDGDGHTLSNLTINSTNDGQGLFGFIKGGAVKDLTLKDVDVTGQAYVGAVVGTIYSGSITNVSVSGSVASTGSNAGGIAGRARTNCTVSDCYNAAAVTAGGNYAGGITSSLWNKATVTNCYNTGAVSGNSYVAGIAGQLGSGACTISNSHNVGKLTSNDGSTVYGVGSSSEDHTVSNCYYLDTYGTDDYATAKSADEFASGEVAWLLQSGQSAQAWGQTLTGDADEYPVLTDEESRLVVKVTVQDEDETVLSTSYINSGEALDESVYPDTGAYAFYSDEDCTKRIEDVVSQTYSADTTVYVKAIVTATVYVDGEAETISVVEGETYDLTALVPDGYLYGGAFTDEDFADVIDPDTCGSGVAFTPKDGETYYVKLVDESYFQIKCLLAYQGYTPTNLWLVTNIDSDGYASYGFDLLYSDDETDSLVVTDEAAKQLYQELEINGKTYTGTVDISDFTGFTDDDYDEDDLDRNLVGYFDLSEMVEDLLDMDSVTFVPFFVTQDGVKVTGAVQRTVSLTSGATSVSGMYSCEDKSVASTARSAEEDEDSGSMILLLSTSLRVSATALVTNIEDETTTYTITKYDGDTVTTQEVEAGAASGTVEYAEKDGYLFAGWFTDEDCTTAADFSDVTGDMTVYAKYVSADYLQVKASTVSSKGVVKSIRMISAADSKNYAEVGFLYTYSDSEGSATAKYATSLSGKTAKSLFGVVTGSKLIYADLSVSGMEANTAVTITPYWVTLDGTTVCGTGRTITYTGSGIE